MDKQIEEIINRQQEYEFFKQASFSEKAALSAHNALPSGIQPVFRDSFLTSEVLPKASIANRKQRFSRFLEKSVSALYVLLLVLFIFYLLLLFIGLFGEL